MSQLWGTMKRMFRGGSDRPPDLESTLNELRGKTPTPVFWLIGKTQSGKTSIIKFLTGAEDAAIGSGFRPTTKTTRRYEFPTPDAPLLSFLDTRGLDEPTYDPTADVAALESLAHLVIVTAKATDFAQGNVRATLEPIRNANPSRPVVLCITTLHEAIPRQPLPTPNPFGDGSGGLRSPLASDVPDDLRRCIEHHATAFEGLYDALVPLDFTKPEDLFPEPNYGGEHLKETLLRLLPEAYRQTLLRLREATDTLKDVHLRHAVPVIMGYSTMAATAGAVPVPFVDMIIIPGIQRDGAPPRWALRQPMTTDRFKEIAAAVGVGMVSATRAAGHQVHPDRRLGCRRAVGGARPTRGSRCATTSRPRARTRPDARRAQAYYQEQYAAAEKQWKQPGEAR